eukprot:CAMPEP_0197458298 /NCGR_PEP_ID=MMETSP1175-20131217/48277_1 /TAXON_ID=1003142 /ORGANISM="Triceratium dubium, Strain CCMP147" /LENGTH=34 /DNA_ID= /DNA_START= /DNA_END= /DNA_ORIENTATION=
MAIQQDMNTRTTFNFQRSPPFCRVSSSASTSSSS